MAHRSIFFATLASLVLASGCGARSDLDGVDRLSRRDAGLRDAGARDAGRPPSDGGDAGVDAAICGGPCDDGVLCNGRERCDPVLARCVTDPPDCDDGDECTVDTCDRVMNACAHRVMERDADGDGVGACSGDCDDTDPRIATGFLEMCDMLDNDCDTRTDEGVLSECNDCRPGCNRVRIPDATGGWDLEDSAGVEVVGDELTLSSTRTETFFAWIANTMFGTITKLDTRDGTQSAEYDSVLFDGTNGARPAGERCETQSAGGNCPSRTAVDLRGAVYIANRAFFNQGTVTKIAGLEADCIDRNGNGTIETSRDLDADGRIERGVPGEFLGQADECILWTVDVGDIGDVPRAIAVDASGSVWVGLHDGAEALQLDANDGSVIRTVALPRSSPFSGYRPYGAAADSNGNIWFVESASGSIVSVDAATGAAGSIRTAVSRDPSMTCPSSYGIAIDERDRVWVAGFLCESAFRYDPRIDDWFEVDLPDSGATRGIAADGNGRIYVASSHEWIRFFPDGSITASAPISRLTIFNSDSGRDMVVHGTPENPLPGLGTSGVGLASDGQVWLINQDSSSATRFDPNTGVARDFPTGDNPYTYSDFTGFALRTFTAPNGFVRAVVEGCPFGPTEWERLDWSADTPGGTRIEVRARTANDFDGLRTATFVGPYESRPTELQLEPGPLGPEPLLELEISLFSDGGAVSPSIRDVTVQFHCPI